MDIDMKIKEERNDNDFKDRGRERERSRRDRPSRFSSGGRDRSPIRERRRIGDRRVYVSNVAYESRWQDIKDLFRAEVGEVTYVELFMDENDKPRGCGVVEFETAELASKAVEKMHRFDVKGRKLVVKEMSDSTLQDIDVERDKYGRPLPNRSRGGGDREQPSSSSNLSRSSRDEPPRNSTWDGGNNQVTSLASSNVISANSNLSSKFGNMYGLSPQFLESLWIAGPLVSKVFVANLDYKVDDKKLREVFKLAGKVIHAEISVDKEGKSRGFGVVEYEHPVEAVQAISLLHNQVLYDRRLTVRMDRVDKAEGPPKLPEGLKGIGMGLGTNGTILTDVSRNLPSLANNSPLAGLASNVQTLQAAAAAAQAAQAAQVAHVAHLGQASLNPVNQTQLAGLPGSSSLGHNLASVGSLLTQSLNVSEHLATLNANANFGGSSLVSTNSQPLNAALGGGLSSGLGQALNTSISSSIGPGIGAGSGLGNNSFSNNLNSPNVFMGSSAPNSSAFGRDFDSMSAALTNSQGNFSSLDRDNFRMGNNNSLNSNFNGSSRQTGGTMNMNSSSQSASNRGSDTVIVKNLPPNSTWMYLRDKFRDVGDVKYVEMRSKDSGIIKFATDWEAERAVREMDRARFEGRTIDVILI